ncbi:hypothetical protein [Fructilactobacillus fructivorans]|uniref:Uncharacterized protein n=1 Tax=Fructilactobacillus fructivorans TaxID=1614 RepID=A0A0C1PQ92_9LACO|nr:hypothetical protein [Fructilactobacillus fructivorans]KID42061.1 hypothetical protein LfDm3_0466 [Fructilactobacillus fructivorans]
MKTFIENNQTAVKAVILFVFIILNTLIWLFASQVDLLSVHWTSRLVVLVISEFLWSASLLLFIIHYDPRINLLLNIIPVVLALITLFPILLTILFAILGITNIIVMIPKFKLENYYGLVCFSFLNSIAPVISFCYLDNQYLESSVLVNVGILFCLYCLFFVPFFHHRLESKLNFIFILIFAGFLLANFSIVKCIILIALVLISYGIQIFSEKETLENCLLSFIIIGLAAFI